MKLPFDKIHDCLHSFGFLICPNWRRDRYGNFKWIAYFEKGSYYKAGFYLTDKFGFHIMREGCHFCKAKKKE